MGGETDEARMRLIARETREKTRKGLRKKQYGEWDGS